MALAAVAWFSTLQPAGAAEPMVRIILNDEAHVDGDTFTLGQISAIEAPNGELASQLGDIDMGQSPLPGQRITVHPDKVNFRLKQNLFDTQRCVIQANGPVTVVRRHSTVSGEQIRAAVETFIKSHAPWDADQMEIRPIRYDQSHILPNGSVEIKVSSPKHTDWLGPVPFKVSMIVDGRVMDSTSVPTYIEVWQEVVLAAKPLGRNQPITEADIRIERMNLARVPSNAIFRPDQVLGNRANRAIAVNSVLRSDQVEIPPAIRKGDVVQVLAETKVLKITTMAVAQENGGVGESIRMMNVRSKRKFHATVIDAQTVKVEF